MQTREKKKLHEAKSSKTFKYYLQVIINQTKPQKWFKWRNEKMDDKAQGSLEYLLLIGGAVLVAVIVIALISGMLDESETASSVEDAQGKIGAAIGDVNIPTGSSTPDPST
jgi:hypothetical protein